MSILGAFRARAQSLVVHKSRLEREKEAALAAQEAARSGAPGGSHQKCALPGYMRATAASSAMQRVRLLLTSRLRDPFKASPSDALPVFLRVNQAVHHALH